MVEQWAVAEKIGKKSRMLEKILTVVTTKFALRMIVMYSRLSTITGKPITMGGIYEGKPGGERICR